MWTSLLEILGFAWWVEISTENPYCTYYFGPFANSKDADQSKSGYIEDLEKEGAQGIKVAIKRCKPSKLTIYDDGAEKGSRGPSATVFSSGQA